MIKANRQKGVDGFVEIDMIVGVGMFAVVAMGIAQAVITMQQQVANTHERLIAIIELQNRIEAYRSGQGMADALVSPPSVTIARAVFGGDDKSLAVEILVPVELAR